MRIAMLEQCREGYTLLETKPQHEDCFKENFPFFLLFADGAVIHLQSSSTILSNHLIIFLIKSHIGSILGSGQFPRARCQVSTELNKMETWQSEGDKCM